MQITVLVFEIAAAVLRPVVVTTGTKTPCTEIDARIKCSIQAIAVSIVVGAVVAVKGIGKQGCRDAAFPQGGFDIARITFNEPRLRNGDIQALLTHIKAYI